jgi:GT2 family glycosyltransferase
MSIPPSSDTDRPGVSVVMPFAGSRAEAEAALSALAALRTGPADELILVDNGGSLRDPLAGSLREPGGAGHAGVIVVRAEGERSPAHARNVGAAHAVRDWILFLDADCHAGADLLDRFLSEPIADDVGALAGAVVPAPGAVSFAARYGAARSFLNQDAHLAHGYMPRAVAANLLVRRAAFEAVGGFYEGVRAAEDTDFSWRLQRAGWRLAARPQARVEHSYRTTVRALRRQWRGYAAGRAWLARRYDGFAPEPALFRAAGRVVHLRGPRRSPAAPPPAVAPPRPAPLVGPSRLERGGFLALDALLGVEELAGFALSNRPHRDGTAAGAVNVVLVAERFPAKGDPLADFALTLAGARIEAAARPEALEWRAASDLRVDYREDDGAGERLVALIRLAVRHPWRCMWDLALGSRRRSSVSAPGLAAIAPAVIRLLQDDDARVLALGTDDARAVAARLAHLAGRRLDA